MALTLSTQAALVEAGFAPTADADFKPTGKFIYEYTNSRGDARRIEVGPVEDMNDYVRISRYTNGKLLQAPVVEDIYEGKFALMVEVAG